MEPTYVVTRIREALARDAAELGILVEVLDERVVLNGVVATPDRRARLDALVRPLCAGYALLNLVTVRPPTSAAGPERVP